MPKKKTRSGKRGRSRSGSAVPSSPSSPQHTPKRARTGVMTEPFSPARITRLEEKTQLQSLNKRLELHFIRLRERQASSEALGGELEALRDQAAADLAAAKEAFQTELARLRGRYEHLSGENADLKSQLSGRDKQLEAAEARLGREQERVAELEKWVEERDGLLRDARNNLYQAQQEYAELEADQIEDGKRLKALEAELDALKGSAGRDGHEAAEALARLAALQKENDRLKAFYGGRVAELEAANAKLQDKLDAEEDYLRKEFGAQLKKILSDRHDTFTKEKEEAMAALRKDFDKRCADLEGTIDALEEEAREAAGEKDRVLSELASLRESVSAHDSEVQLLQSQVREANAARSAAEHRLEITVGEKEDTIDALRAELARKDRSFDALMDVKIALAVEIKSYRELLSSEEKRLGLQASTGGASGGQDPTDQVFVAGADRAHKSVTIKNGSTEEVALGGWRLTSESHTGKGFVFGKQAVLGSGASLRVWLGRAFKGKRGKSHVWAVAKALNPKGDTLQLLDEDGDSVSSFEVIGKH